ncbi:hypothetical protein N9917_01090 [Deltaproteobacteria bacterium]|nr:hypothetical protein [Deltaproteobacteria bacterium]
MPQDPILVDQLSVEPGTTTFGTRTIDRDPTDGGLRFADPNVTASLAALVGVRNITGLYLVGRAGDGAPYTTIQAALDAVPELSSVAAPSLVLVSAGVYNENLVIEKDGVVIQGLGGVTITNVAADATVLIQESPTTIPTQVVLQNLTIINTDGGEECVLVSGANNYAEGTYTVGTAPLTVGDTLTIGGLPLTGITGTRTAGSDDFSVDGSTVDIVAAEIADAINDAANSFAVTVVAVSSAGGIVTVTAIAAGAGGNAITIVSSTGDVVTSGGTLTGGGSSGSPVGSESIDILDCHLQAEGIGAFQVYAEAVNNVRVQGGTWRGSSSTSKLFVSQCASFRVHGLEWMNDMEFAYDTGGDIPTVAGSVYEVSDAKRANDVLAGFTGAGSLLLSHLGSLGDVSQGGDSTLTIKHSHMGLLSVSDTTAATLINTPRGAASVGAGTPTLAESMFTGSVAFAASASEAVVLPVPQPDALYSVVVSADEPSSVSAKTAAGFTIDLTGAVTEAVLYTIIRQIPG